jgi:hypothetical protein
MYLYTYLPNLSCPILPPFMVVPSFLHLWLSHSSSIYGCPILPPFMVVPSFLHLWLSHPSSIYGCPILPPFMVVPFFLHLWLSHSSSIYGCPILPPFMYLFEILLNLFSSWIKLKYCLLDVKQKSINQIKILVQSYSINKHLAKFIKGN